MIKNPSEETLEKFEKTELCVSETHRITSPINKRMLYVRREFNRRSCKSFQAASKIYLY